MSISMLVNRATGLVRETAWHRPRYGKTARDHANGCQERNHLRKLARANWQKSSEVNNKSRMGLEVPPVDYSVVA